MDFYQHNFVAPIEKHSMGFNNRGELFYNVLFVPDALIASLPLKQYPRLRIDGELHDMPFEGALQPARGRWYVLLSQKFMKAHKLALGDEVEVRFNVGDQDYVDVPLALQKALDEHDVAYELWQAMTPGKKRGFAAQVASAKREETRRKRAQKMIEYILEGKNAGGRWHQSAVIMTLFERCGVIYVEKALALTSRRDEIV